MYEPTTRQCSPGDVPNKQSAPLAFPYKRVLLRVCKVECVYMQCACGWIGGWLSRGRPTRAQASTQAWGGPSSTSTRCMCARPQCRPCAYLKICTWTCAALQSHAAHNVGTSFGLLLSQYVPELQLWGILSCKGHQRLSATQDENRDEPFSVIEADFYGANVLMALPDDELVAKVGPALQTTPGHSCTRQGLWLT